MSVYGDFYDDVVRNERVPNAVKKYINREVLYELSYADPQLQNRGKNMPLPNINLH